MITKDSIGSAIQIYTHNARFNVFKKIKDVFITPYQEFFNELNDENLTENNIARLVQILCRSQPVLDSEKEIYNGLLNLLLQSDILAEDHYNILRDLENKNAIESEDYQRFLSLDHSSRLQLMQGAEHLLSAGIAESCYSIIKMHDEPHSAGYILNFYARSERLSISKTSKISTYIQETSHITTFADAIKIFDKNNIYELKQSQMEVVQKHNDPINAAQAMVYLKRTPSFFSDLLTNDNLNTIKDHFLIDDFSSALGVLVDDPENNRLNQEKFDILKEHVEPTGAAKIISCLEKTKKFFFFDLLNQKNIDYVKETNSFGDLPQALEILVKQAPGLINQEIFEILKTVDDPVNVAHAMICLKTTSRFFFSDYLTKENIQSIIGHPNIEEFADALYLLQHNDNNENYITQEIINIIKGHEHPVELAEILICLKQNGLYNDNHVNRAKVNSKLIFEIINKFKEGNDLTSDNLDWALRVTAAQGKIRDLLHPKELAEALIFLKEHGLDNADNITKAQVNPTLLCAVLNRFQSIRQLTPDNLTWALDATSSYSVITDHKDVAVRAELLIFLKKKGLATPQCIERVKFHSDIKAVSFDISQRKHLGEEFSSETLFSIFDRLENEQLPEYVPAPPIHNNQEHQGEADHELEGQPVDADALPLFPPDYHTLDYALSHQNANVGFPAGDEPSPTYDNLPVASPSMRPGSAPVPPERPEAGHH